MFRKIEVLANLAIIITSIALCTVLLALSIKCHFCTESAPFYQGLQQKKPNDVYHIAVFPQRVEESRDYLNRLGVSIDGVIEGSLVSLPVSATPTLILLDKNGIVTDSWVGKLSDTEAAKVLNQIAVSN